MLDKKLENAFNTQINKELYSAYLYLSMQSYFKKISLDGFAQWMSVQVQEEMAHAQGLYNYVFERGEEVELFAIDKPEGTWNNTLEVFEAVLSHEQYVTSLINDLITVAEDVHDRAATNFLGWYIDEQVEEEASVTTVLNKVRLTKDDPRALLLLDKELGARQFNPPTIK